MSKQKPLLSISNLNVKFLSSSCQSAVLSGVDMELHKGHSLALVGESGCGKSVTAQALMRLLNPETCEVSGEIWFDGEPLHLASEHQLQKIRGKKIGMVFQDPSTSLNPTMKVGDQIAEAIIYHQRITKREAKTRATTLLSRVGISDPALRFDNYPFQLSGGMRQRVMIAIALSCDPLLLIADEPTTSLDVTVQADILDLIKTICKTSKMSLLLITHDFSIIAGICDRVAVMQSGKIVEEGTVDQLFYEPFHPLTKSLIAANLEEEVFL